LKRRLCAGLLVAGLAGGCASPVANLRGKQDLVTSAGQFAVLFAEHDAGADKIVEKAVEAATPKLTRWGGLKQPVKLNVMPDHAALEQAVDKGGYPWLRAWARYDDVFVQSPRTWSFFGATQAEVNETLLHELTHCVMYQQAGTVTTWRRKEIPLWFKEGMASYSANQGYRWPTLEDLAQYYAAHPDADPVGAPQNLYQGQSDVVYGAAHHAFSFLVSRYGEATVRQVLANMSAGQVFPDAFTQAVGIAPPKFVDDFKHYVRWRAFRGSRLQKPITLRPVGESGAAQDAAPSDTETPASSPRAAPTAP